VASGTASRFNARDAIGFGVLQLPTANSLQVYRDVTAAIARLRNRDRRPRLVVIVVAERHDHVEAVHGPALEDRDQDLRLARPLLREGGAEQEPRRAPEREECEGPALHEGPSRASSHAYLLWNSGEPRTSAVSFSTSVSFGTRS